MHGGGGGEDPGGDTVGVDRLQATDTVGVDAPLVRAVCLRVFTCVLRVCGGGAEEGGRGGVEGVEVRGKDLRTIL